MFSPQMRAPDVHMELIPDFHMLSPQMRAAIIRRLELDFETNQHGTYTFFRREMRFI
jgi:hypothetical protein